MSWIRSHARPLLRFSLVGVVNTGVYYLAYLGLIVVLPYFTAHLLAWAVSISASFFLNCRFTYHVQPTWRRFAVYPLSNLPNIIATSVGVVALIEVFNLNVKIAPLIAGICAVPFSYLLAKFLLTAKPERGGLAEDAVGLDRGNLR